MTVSLVGCSAIEHKPSPMALDPPALPSAPEAVLEPAPTQPEAMDSPDPAPAQSAQELISLRRHVWIRERPWSGSARVGLLGRGSGIQVRGQPIRCDGCDAIYAAEPRL